MHLRAGSVVKAAHLIRAGEDVIHPGTEGIVEETKDGLTVVWPVTRWDPLAGCHRPATVSGRVFPHEVTAVH